MAYISGHPHVHRSSYGRYEDCYLLRHDRKDLVSIIGRVSNTCLFATRCGKPPHRGTIVRSSLNTLLTERWIEGSNFLATLII